MFAVAADVTLHCGSLAVCAARDDKQQCRSQINQLQLARHLRGNVLPVKISPLIGVMSRRRQTDRGSDEVMVAENSIGRVEPNPAGARKKNFRPGVERTFRPRLYSASPSRNTRS